MGYGAVWVVARGERDSQLLRIDPVTGEITHCTGPQAPTRSQRRRRLGAVRVVGASSSTLYRLDARTGERRGRVLAVGGARPPPGSDARPCLGRSHRHRSADARDREGAELLSQQGEDTGGFGSVRSSDAPSGNVVRWGLDWEVDQTVRVVASTPVFAGGCLTSIASGAGGIWVTVASAFDYACGL